MECLETARVHVVSDQDSRKTMAVSEQTMDQNLFATTARVPV